MKPTKRIKIDTAARRINRRFRSIITAAAPVLITATLVSSLLLSALSPTARSVSADSKSKAILKEDQKIIHLLNRAGYGPRPGDVEKVKRLGIDKYLDLQLHPDRIDDSAIEARLSDYPSLKMSIAQIQEQYPLPQLIARELGLRQPNGQLQPKQNNPNAQGGAAEDENQKREYRQQINAYYRSHDLKPPQFLLQELQGQKLTRAIYSERQLQEVMTDFWFNHFNIFWAKNADRDLTTNYEMNVIRPNTMSKFKDLLMATAKSPAMLVYLDNFQSTAPDAKVPQGPARFNRRPGAFGNQRPGLRPNDPGVQGQRMPNQNQQQAANQLRNRKPGINENYAREIMELHTLGVEGGYTQKDVQEVARCLTGWTLDRPRQGSSFVFRPWMHDDGEKTVLGRKIPAGGGIKDGEMVIDILAHHPSTAKFISTKLVRRLVSDTPPQSLVDRVASVYLKTDGDIREMLRTIFTSNEFNSPEVYRAKIKSPFELAASASRALGADLTNAQQTSQFIAKMGQPLYLYQAPTGYPDRADQWVNTGSLLERLNYGLALTTNRLRGASVDVKQLSLGIDNSDRARVLDRAIALLLKDDVSSQTRAVLEKQLKEGVPVKGELGEAPRIPTGGDEDAMASGSMEALPSRNKPVGKAEKAANTERLERRLGIREDAGPQMAMSAADIEIARVFGLVLGSPEFQRR